MDGEPVIHLRSWRVCRRTRLAAETLGRTSACPEVGRFGGGEFEIHFAAVKRSTPP
jgi:hypothetical protein